MSVVGDSAEEGRTVNPGVVVGIAIRGGRAYFAVVECPDTFVAADPLDRIAPSEQVELPEGLGDFHVRVAQELRRLRPRAVGVTFTRKYKGWSADQAFRRFSLDAAAMLAAVSLDIPCQQVREEDAARAVGVAPTKLAEKSAAMLGIEQTDYWSDRVWAIATALHIAKDGC